MTARVQNAGLARYAAAMVALAHWFQWGTGTGAAASANAVTTTGTTEARTSATQSNVTTTVTNDTMQSVGSITAAAGVTITEVGLFDAAGTGSPPTGGNMDVYYDFTGVVLLTGDGIAFTSKVKVA